jgi:hypothetical protein
VLPEGESGFSTTVLDFNVTGAPAAPHTLILAGAFKNGEGPSGLLTLPEAAWELSLGIYCAWKGFRLASPLAAPGVDLTKEPVRSDLITAQ